MSECNNRSIDISDRLNNPDGNKSIGPDNIHPYVLKRFRFFKGMKKCFQRLITHCAVNTLMALKWAPLNRFITVDSKLYSIYAKIEQSYDSTMYWSIMIYYLTPYKVARGLPATGLAPAGKTSRPEKFPAHDIKSTLLACCIIYYNDSALSIVENTFDGPE